MRTSTRQDWLAAAALLAGLLACFVVPPATTGSSAARAVAAMAIAALIALAVGRTPFSFAPHVRTAFVLLVSLSLWYVATRAWAVYPAGSMVESSRVSAFVLMAWAAHTTVVGDGARRLLLAGVGIAAFFICLPDLVDVLRDGAPAARVPGELGYWNASAIAALVLVPIAVTLAGSAKRRLIALAALLIPIAGITAVATASRGALVALVVALLFQALLDPDYRGGLPRALVAVLALAMVIAGLAIDGMPVYVSLLAPALVAGGGFALIRARRTHVERRRLRALEGGAQAVDAAATLDETPVRRRRISPTTLMGAAIVATLGVLLIALVVSANDDRLPDRIGGTGSDTAEPAAANDSVERLTSTDDSRRFVWWQEGVQMWKRAPLHGRGGGAFGALHVDAPGDTADHVHSMPLEVLLETGLIGLALLVGAAITFMRVLRRGRRTPERALGGAIAALLITQSLVDWTLSFPQLMAMLAIAGPLALQLPPKPDELQAPPAAKTAPTRGTLPTSEASLVAPLAMLVSLAIATLVAFTPMLATLLADQGAARLDDGQPHRAANLFAQSEQLVPSMETLTLQVISLQSAGQAAEAKRVLRDRQQVWFEQLDGLLLAQSVLGEDPELGPRIERRLAEMQRDRDTRFSD
ncbi:MAG: O-antigen ligase family protein [Gaiellales bacterium]